MYNFLYFLTFYTLWEAYILKKTLVSIVAVSAITSSLTCVPVHAATTQGLTASEVIQGLLKTYAGIPVWPKGLMTVPSPGTEPTPAYWANGITPTQPSEWVGLSTVFPGDSSSDYPSLLGMTNVSGDTTVTAGIVAQWILNWEEAAHKVSLAWEPYQNPFDLLNLYSFWYGTDIKNAQAVITAHDLTQIEQNVQDVSRGYRLLSPNKIEVLMPMINHTGDFSGSLYDGYLTKENYPQRAIAPTVQELDATTFTFEKNGNVFYDSPKSRNAYMILRYDFVKNGIITGAGGPVWIDIPYMKKWLKANPTPRTLTWDKGPYTGEKASHTYVSGIASNYFSASLWATNAFLISKDGGGGHLADTPSYVIASKNGRITKVSMELSNTYPELTLYGIGG